MTPGAVVHPDAALFFHRALPWLMEREDEHNLILGLAAGLHDAQPAPGPEGYLFGTVESAGTVVGCFFRTPPYKAGLTRMPLEAAPQVAEALGRRYPSLPAVFGPVDVARAVAEAWSALRGVAVREGVPQRMYRLDAVIRPREVPGALRFAVQTDLPLVHLWADAFAVDAGAGFATPRELHAQWVERRQLYLWDVGGAPVSMALATGRTSQGVRIGYVFTPEEMRRNGFASALVAEVSQRQLDAGADFCVLYTDLRNATSNAVYQRLGYKPLCDLLDVEFEGGGDDDQEGSEG